MTLLLKKNNLSSSLFLSHLPYRDETSSSPSSSFHLTECLKNEYKTLCESYEIIHTCLTFVYIFWLKLTLRVKLHINLPFYRIQKVGGLNNNNNLTHPHDCFLCVRIIHITKGCG